MINDVFHYGLEGLIAIGLFLLGLSGIAIDSCMIYLFAIKIESHLEYHGKILNLMTNLLMYIGIFIVGYFMIMASIVIIANRYYGEL